MLIERNKKSLKTLKTIRLIIITNIHLLILSIFKE